jgi:hypothetical protein
MEQTMTAQTRILSLVAALAMVGLALASQPARANVPVYTYAYTGLDLNSDEIIDIEDDALAFMASGAHAELTSNQGSLASATSHFGQNLAYARAVNPPGGPEQIGALSIWSDLFTISGGVGNGMAQVSAVVSGALSGNYYSAFGYALIKSDAPLLPQDILPVPTQPIQPDDFFFNLTSTLYQAGGSVVLSAYNDSVSAAGPVQIVLGNSFDFTYDSPFYLTGILVVGASESGEAEFSHTADFGMTVVGDGEVDALSGTAYAAAQPVPEPETWAMLLAGLGLVALRLRRG